MSKNSEYNIYALQVTFTDGAPTAKFLENLGETFEEAREVLIKKYLTPNRNLICKAGKDIRDLIYKGQIIAGLAMDDRVMPVGDTSDTIIETKEGFICLFCKELWYKGLKEVYLVSWSDNDWHERVEFS